jgi:alpha/beta superfamily hydrolase
VHPDHNVIGTLRASLADAGYTTLSIQMPVQKADAGVDDYYPAVFPDAVERIRSAARWLEAKGAKRIVLLSHSMGSWMSNVYYEQTDAPPFSAWVCMGLTGGYGNMRNVRVPVLDVYGENDLPSVLRADWRRRMTIGSIAGSRQARIAGADHFYAGKEKELAAAVDSFIRERVLK